MQTGFGPFVAVYLASQHWSPGEIGLLLTVGGLAGILAQLPGGALVDWAEAKRLLIALALLAIAAGALIFAFTSQKIMIYLAEILHGSTAGIVRPAMTAIGLGLVGHRALSGRVGRNHRYLAFGTALTAALMGGVGHLVSKSMVFLFAAALCIPAGWALTRIRGEEIDYARARSAKRRDRPREAARLFELARHRRLLIFVLSLSLFQFADASMMPLASGRLGAQHHAQSELVTSALVVVPQLVTGLIAMWIARRADGWGRRPLLLAGYALLPVRALFFALVPDPWWLVAVQALDGVTAAVIGIMMPLVVADLVRGSGRYNLAQGAAGTATGIGAALSTVASGYVAQLFGYAAGFSGLALVALSGLALIYWFLPETRPR